MGSYKKLLNSTITDENIRVLTAQELMQLKSIMLGCYKDVAAICKKNNITLMLGGGSALGSIRHQGYIPWDDDLDLLMPRSDYNLFKNIFDKELGQKYILNAPNFKGKAINRFPNILIKDTKLIGLGANPNKDTNKIKLDIFIIENIPMNKFIRFIKGLTCTILMFVAGQVSTYENRNSTISSFMSKANKSRNAYMKRICIGKFFSFLSYAKWCNLVDKACQYNHETGLLGIPTGRKHYFGEIGAKNVYLPISTGIFEGITVNLPGDYNAYLKKLYGNYMELPPKEDRERHNIVDIQF